LRSCIYIIISTYSVVFVETGVPQAYMDAVPSVEIPSSLYSSAYLPYLGIIFSCIYYSNILKNFYQYLGSGLPTMPVES
jgi:hypothetical protein